MLQRGKLFGSDVHRQFSEVLLRGAKKSFLPASGFPANDSGSHSSDPFIRVLLLVQVIQQSFILERMHDFMAVSALPLSPCI